jgi:hypothetical protein
MLLRDEKERSFRVTQMVSVHTCMLFSMVFLRTSIQGGEYPSGRISFVVLLISGFKGSQP